MRALGLTSVAGGARRLAHEHRDPARFAENAAAGRVAVFVEHATLAVCAHDLALSAVLPCHTARAWSGWIRIIICLSIRALGAKHWSASRVRCVCLWRVPPRGAVVARGARLSIVINLAGGTILTNRPVPRGVRALWTQLAWRVIPRVVVVFARHARCAIGRAWGLETTCKLLPRRCEDAHHRKARDHHYVGDPHRERRQGPSPGLAIPCLLQ